MQQAEAVKCHIRLTVCQCAAAACAGLAVFSVRDETMSNACTALAIGPDLSSKVSSVIKNLSLLGC